MELVMSAVDKGLDALIAPKKITLGALARLERMKSPMMEADFSSLNANLAAIAALRMSPEEFVSKADNMEAAALELADRIDAKEYHDELERIAEGLVQFGVLMPRPDEDAKKNAEPETAG